MAYTYDCSPIHQYGPPQVNSSQGAYQSQLNPCERPSKTTTTNTPPVHPNQGSMPPRGTEILEFLARRGLGVNAQGAHGRSALHIAAISSPQSLQTLLEHGANPNLRDDMGHTPLHLLAMNGSPMPISRAARIVTETDLRAIRGSVQQHQFGTPWTLAMQLLLHYGANPALKNHLGQTPLHLASKADSLQGAYLLTLYGAPVEAQDVYGYTALHLCALQDSRRLSQYPDGARVPLVRLRNEGVWLFNAQGGNLTTRGRLERKGVFWGGLMT